MQKAIARDVKRAEARRQSAARRTKKPKVICSAAESCEISKQCPHGRPHKYEGRSVGRCFYHVPYVEGGVHVHCRLAGEKG